ncbi:MAG TPA: GNAT family N-acetyltransferase [Solirubrobacteraceae bacterium]|nr:GNAT family N-acetyltransferase [Solirubrobacteraceae bacterium]
MSTGLQIRPAARPDVPLLLSLVRALAHYERAPERVTGTEAMLDAALFGPAAVAEAVLAEREGAAVGFALFYTTFSTWQCLPGMWLEDLFVLPEQRRGGVGRRLLARLAAVARQRGYGRLEWSALDWNTSAIDFYREIGAEMLGEWEHFRLEGDALGALVP